MEDGNNARPLTAHIPEQGKRYSIDNLSFALILHPCLGSFLTV